MEMGKKKAVAAGGSPVIVLSDDDPRRQQLCKKLAEYRERLKSCDAAEKEAAPCDASLLRMDTICKIAVLEKLLNGGKVVVRELAADLIRKHKDDYVASDFRNAISVITDYCDTGGQNVWGGTGLPAIGPAAES